MNRRSILFDERIPVESTEESALSFSPAVFSNVPSHIPSDDALNRSNRSSSTLELSVCNMPHGCQSDDFNNRYGEEKTFAIRPFRSADYKLVSNIFIGSMMAQYILIFFAIPFSEVDNRPAASVLSCLLGYLSFLLCVLMIPAGLINVPTNLSFQSSLISCMLKIVDFTANVYSSFLCLKVKEPMIEYTFDQNRLPVRPLDITVYIQIVSCLLLVSSIVSLFFATVVFLFNFTYFQSKQRYENQGYPEKRTLTSTSVQ